MRKKTRAPGGGRKPLDPSGTAVVPVRIRSDVLQAIDRLARKHELSRSSIIRAALRRFVGRVQIGTTHAEALADAIVLLTHLIQRRSGKTWIEDPITGMALRKQVERLIFHFAPTPQKPVPPEAEVIPPELDVVGALITMIENAAPVKGVPFARRSDDPESAILWALAQAPQYGGLGSGWQRNRAIWQGDLTPKVQDGSKPRRRK